MDYLMRTSKNTKILIKQHDISDCGAACLTSVFAYHGLIKPISKIRLEAGTNKNGTSLLGLVEAAKKENFVTQAVKINDKTVYSEDLPAIAHLNIKKFWYHYVVIYKKTRDSYLIMDPAEGKLKTVPKADFETDWTGVLLILAPGKNFKTRRDIIPVRKRIADILKIHKIALYKAVSGAIIYSILGIATAKYIEYLSDIIIPGQKLDKLNFISIAILLVIILRVIVGFLKNILIIQTGRKIDRELISNYNRHLLSLPINFFNSMKTGEILTRINDAIKIRAFINSIAQELIVNFLIVAFTLAMMLHYSPGLSLILTTSIPFLCLVYRFLNRINKKHLRKNMELSAEMESQLVENIKSVKTIKAFTKEEYFFSKLNNISNKLLLSIYKTSRDFSLSSHFSEMITSVWLVLIIWFGTKQVISGQLSYGELFSFYALYSYISGPLIHLILSNRGIHDARIAAERLFQVMDLDCENTKPNIEAPDELKKVVIKVNKLKFNFPGQLDLLKDVSFTCYPGTITAIIGDNGSGKSTLLSHLLGFYKAGEGSIVFNETNIQDISLYTLRQNIAWVPQKIDLFSGSFGENITFDKSHWDNDLIKLAIDLSGLEFLIDGLPQGLKTYLSEEGNNFSGGEKQKIAFARAVYRNTPVMLLDEPSASMDSSSEKRLITGIQYLKTLNKTIIIVAHKLSMVKQADQILFLKQGKIIERGDHNSLIEAETCYKELWKEQNYSIT